MPEPSETPTNQPSPNQPPTPGGQPTDAARPARPDATPPVAGRTKHNKRSTDHETFPARSVNPEAARELAILAARTLADDKCENIVVLDVTELSQSFDYLVIGSGTSDRQMVTAADDTAKAARKLQGDSAVFGRSQDPRSTWIVLDMIDVVVHVFEPNTRAHYDLEMLWGDAPKLPWQRPGLDNRDHAGVHKP